MLIKTCSFLLTRSLICLKEFYRTQKIASLAKIKKVVKYCWLILLLEKVLGALKYPILTAGHEEFQTDKVRI